MSTSFPAVRYKAARDRPYLASAYWAMTPVPVDGLNTFAVDKWWRVYYDPAMIEEWGVDMAAVVLFHEVWHLLRKHHVRAENLRAHAGQGMMINIAEDMEINDDVRAERLTLPDGCVYPDTYGFPEGRVFEEYFRRMEEMSHQQQQLTQPQGGIGDCGSGAHGEPRDYEHPPPAGKGEDEKGGKGKGAGEPGASAEGGSDTPGIGEAEGELVRRKVAAKIREHVKSRGTVPAGARRWAERILRPSWDPKKALAAAVRHAFNNVAGCVDYSYTRPSRRQSVYAPVIAPALRKPEPNVALVIDTSGSMGDEDLGLALGVVARTLKAIGQVGVRLISCDAAATRAKKTFNARAVTLYGGGGTDMCVGIAEAARLKPRPDVCIVVTDGETPWPTRPPRGMRLVVALTRGNPSYSQTPSWAHVVQVTHEPPE